MGDEPVKMGESVTDRQRLMRQIRDVQEKIGQLALDGEMEVNGQVIRYPTKNNVVDTVKNKLLLNDLAIVPTKLEVVSRSSNVARDHYGNEHVVERVVVKETFRVSDTNTGYYEEYEWLGEASDTMAKGVTVAASYALRDFLMHLFNITVSGDASYEDASLIRQATQKMDMEGIRTVLQNKAMYIINKATLTKVKAEAKKRDVNPSTWNVREMTIEDLMLMIEIALAVVNPDKIRTDLEKAAGRNQIVEEEA